MTQANDLGAILNQSRTSFRTRVNVGFQAVSSFHSGGTAPSPTYPNMIWFDTANGVVKLRDAANTSWTVIGTISPFQWSALKDKSGILSSPTLSGASVIISGIPTDAIALDLQILAVTTNSTSNIELQLGTSGGLYASTYAAVTEEMGNTVAYTTTRFALAVGIPSTDVLIGTYHLFKTVDNRWNIQGGTSSILSPYTRNHVINGTVVLPGALDRIGLLSSGGSFTGGGYQLRWYN